MLGCESVGIVVLRYVLIFRGATLALVILEVVPVSLFKIGGVAGCADAS